MGKIDSHNTICITLLFNCTKNTYCVVSVKFADFNHFLLLRYSILTEWRHSQSPVGECLVCKALRVSPSAPGAVERTDDITQRQISCSCTFKSDSMFRVLHFWPHAAHAFTFHDAFNMHEAHTPSCMWVHRLFPKWHPAWTLGGKKAFRMFGHSVAAVLVKATEVQGDTCNWNRQRKAQKNPLTHCTCKMPSWNQSINGEDSYPGGFGGGVHCKDRVPNEGQYRLEGKAYLL